MYNVNKKFASRITERKCYIYTQTPWELGEGVIRDTHNAPVLIPFSKFFPLHLLLPSPVVLLTFYSFSDCIKVWFPALTFFWAHYCIRHIPSLYYCRSIHVLVSKPVSEFLPAFIVILSETLFFLVIFLKCIHSCLRIHYMHYIPVPVLIHHRLVLYLHICILSYPWYHLSSLLFGFCSC